MSQPSYPKNNIGRELIPVTITNQTGRQKLYIDVRGTTDADNPEHKWYHLSNVDGTVELCTPSSKTSYSIEINSDTQTIQLPRLASLRLYFSFDNPLYFVVGENGIPNSPNGTNDGWDYHTLYDFIEMTWVIDPEIKTIEQNSLGGNTSQVDFFGFPMCLSLTGDDGSGKPVTMQSGFSTGGLRDKIFKDLLSMPDPWNKLVVSDSDFNYRALCPYHGMEADVFPRTQLDKYIDEVWKHYAVDTLTCSVEGVIYQGIVNNDILTFKPVQGDADPVKFKKPSTWDVYLNGPNPDIPTKPANAIMAMLQAGFLRSTLMVSSSLPDCDTTKFYQNEPINLYAKTIHKYGTDGKAYAFGFDDVCSQSSVSILYNPTSARITLLEF